MNEIRLDRVSEFKYLKYILGESGIDVAECHSKEASGRKVAGATRSLVKVRGLQFECAA